MSRGARVIERLLLKPAEAAEAFGISRAKMYVMIASGEIRAVTVGERKRIPVSELHRYIEERFRDEDSSGGIPT